jgi:ubiquinone/menaquinone biosynthesis C-methylase UbiE
MGELATDPTRRFSSRVDNYIKYRPGYPSAVIDTLASECGLTEQLIVADVGSGTGILSELFLKHGNPVFGVEPNREMREAGERRLKQYPNFTSVNGTAEATTLPDRSMDFITAGQAFHWFDRIQTRKEFTRILKGGGWVALIWNDRHIDTSPFLCAYEELLHRYGTDCEALTHRNVDAAAIAAFFTPQVSMLRTFDNGQVFDFSGLQGRLLSSSYTPEPDHPNHLPMLDALRAIFDKHQIDGRVEFIYTTVVYFGHLC